MSEAVRSWPNLTSILLSGEDLAAGDTSWAMDEVMKGETSPVQLAGFLIALRAKGESVEEITGLVNAMLAHAVPLSIARPSLDIVGTGGDRLNTVNISTMAAIVAAAAGATIVKHGNRAASSSTGTADVLERLGVRLDLAPADVARVAEEAGITFCFAQTFHPAMRHAGIARRELGVPTAFNVLGPLTNPAQPVASAIGVADARLAPVIAGVLAERGRTALVFRGGEGLDELSVCSASAVWQVAGGTVTQGEITSEDVGLGRYDIAELRGGDPAANAQVVLDVLDGMPGAQRDAVVLNAAGGLVAVELAAQPAAGASPLLERLARQVSRAAEVIDSGAARAKLDEWIAATTRS